MQAVPGLGPVDGDLEQVTVPADQEVLVPVPQHRRLRREQLLHPGPGGGDPVAEAERPGVDRLADRFGRGEQAEKVRVVALGDKAALAGVKAADDDAGPGTVARVLDGVGLDDGRAVGAAGLLRRGPAVDLGLAVGAAVGGPGGRGGGVHADGILCSFGKPDQRLGEEVVAVVVRREGSSVSADEIIAYCRERLAAYKYPRAIRFMDELPKGPSGKILKSALRDG